MTRKVFRPQDYVVAVLFILGAIGPALAGLCCHLVALGFGALWGFAHG
jgi:hypothetical protein